MLLSNVYVSNELQSICKQNIDFMQTHCHSGESYIHLYINPSILIPVCVCTGNLVNMFAQSPCLGLIINHYANAERKLERLH